ncbi:MAG TPA: cation:proton antiporter subunit C [Bryobacteraceae bacterium]|nr:cation:proton antiporter subunit C [Bryobacteraceae bacterium]HWF48421.1 cation:proton antiporter subunit C [Bryobacteraceae bacterium]
MNYLPYAVAAWLFLVGLYGVTSSRNLIHLIMCVGVIQSSSYVLLLAIGYRVGGVAPVFVDIPANSRAVDPVVQALMLTDIVVEVAVTALLLGLAVQVHKRHGTLNPDRLTKISG